MLSDTRIEEIIKSLRKFPGYHKSCDNDFIVECLNEIKRLRAQNDKLRGWLDESRSVIEAYQTPYARNARRHPEAQIDQIASSIREFGFLAPVVVDKDNTIIAGHGRLLAAKK